MGSGFDVVGGRTCGHGVRGFNSAGNSLKESQPLTTREGLAAQCQFRRGDARLTRGTVENHARSEKEKLPASELLLR